MEKDGNGNDRRNEIWVSDAELDLIYWALVLLRMDLSEDNQKDVFNLTDQLIRDTTKQTD